MLPSRLRVSDTRQICTNAADWSLRRGVASTVHTSKQTHSRPLSLLSIHNLLHRSSWLR